MQANQEHSVLYLVFCIRKAFPLLMLAKYSVVICTGRNT